jgi:hypothetical protein
MAPPRLRGNAVDHGLLRRLDDVGTSQYRSGREQAYWTLTPAVTRKRIALLRSPFASRDSLLVAVVRPKSGVEGTGL